MRILSLSFSLIQEPITRGISATFHFHTTGAHVLIP
jgi:hypothetical protein